MKISIITVCLNSVHTIEKTISSVIMQQNTDIEYIIIDGGSNDGTVDIIEKYKDRIAYISSEKDKGIYDAMNKGLLHATGDIVAFLNADDWYESNTLETVERYFNSKIIDVLIGRANVYKGDLLYRVAGNSEREITIGMPCCHQSVFARRELFSQLGGFDTNYRICADYDWLLRMYYQNKVIMKCEDIFVNYSLGGMSDLNTKEVIKEYNSIACSQALLHGENEKIEIIKNIYINEELQYEKESKLEKILMDDIYSLQKFLDEGAKYYIWGTGVFGKKWLEIFEKLGVCVAGFIDNDVSKKEYMGYEVLSPYNITKDAAIFISSIKYEAEIRKQMDTLDIDMNKCLSYQSVLDNI